ncbi:MAG: hypothetical protein DBY35_07080 [Bacteroidales bacterium]|nr:MAG: hypothetical protein DBY35_07080 [Bacteroidales bacterium]
MTRLLQSLYITLISIGLFAVLAAILPGIDMFEPVSRALSEVTITDLHYSSMRDAAPMENDKILIIDTSTSDRGEIADAIEQAATAGASVIGVDIIFSDRDADRDATSKLCRTLSAYKDRIVSAIHLTQWDEKTGAYISTVTTATDSLPLQQGYTNLIDASDNSYIRNYSAAPQGMTPSFPQAMAEMYRASFGDTSPTEATDCGIIDFTPQDFKTLLASDSAGIAAYSDGRMVILGALSSDEDYHFTPTGRQSGAIIQAYSLDTILNDETIQTPGWITWIICFVTVLIASWGFVELRRNFEHRNPTANRYTYAVLGLGNIMYPTAVILLTVFVIGLIYVLSSIYIAPLVIMGSLAFIPVAYDLMGIAKEVFRKSARTAATSALMIFAAVSANAAGNAATPTAKSGEFTAVWEEHGVEVNGKKGMNIKVSFNVNGMKGKEGHLKAFFCDQNGKDIIVSDSRFQAIPGILYSEKHFIPRYDHSIYSDITLFIPYETIPLTNDDTKLLKYFLVMFDENNNVLNHSIWHPFYYSIKTGSQPYFINSDVSGKIKSFSIKNNETKNGKKGINVEYSYVVEGIDNEKNHITTLCNIYDEQLNPLLTELSGHFYLDSINEKTSFKETVECFFPYEDLQKVLGQTTSLKVAATIYDYNYDEICISEYLNIDYLIDNINKPSMSTQKMFATGKVTDDKGEPIIGASVIIPNAQRGTATDIDGNFRLDVEKGTDLKFSYIGMDVETVKFTGEVMNVTLYEEGSKRKKSDKAASSPDKEPNIPTFTTLSTSNNSTTTAKGNGNNTKSANSSTKPSSSTTAGAKQAVKFTFRTPDNTKFSDSNFKISFVTNSKSLTYRISGQSEQYSIPAADISAGVHTIRLPKRSCELTIIDEAQKFHVLNFIYDEDRDLRKSSTLHILAIGVNDYPAQNLNSLKYAEADAKAVVDAFVSRHKYTFGNINKTILLGNNVSCQSIEREIDKIADTAKSNDLAIIFFAGHGLVDNLDKYYLATAETTDGETPRKGSFSASSFNEKIAYINCKLVIFIDACYSGKLVEGMRSGGISNAQFFKELRSTKNGTNIYTSSGSTSQSKEDSRYGHGVFTQALIEACDFKNSDVDSDGRITIKEIRNYLERRIPELTKNQQKPIHRNLEEIDYPLFVK